MPLTNAGRDFITAAIINDGSPVFYEGPSGTDVAHIGVGNGSDNTLPEEKTDLDGASTLRKAMDAGFPTIATNVLTFQSTFIPAEAIFTWAEWGVFNDLTTGTMLNRKVEALGTKTGSQTWQITVTLTVSIGT